MRRWLCLFIAVACVASCQDATQAKLRLHTDLAHAAGMQVNVYGRNAEGNETLLSSTQGPWGPDGVIGSLVLTPPRDPSALSLRVVMFVDRPPQQCATGAFAGCIQASRASSYVSHQAMTIPVGLYRRCLGVECTDGTTCNSLGQCVSAQVDAQSCASSEGCVLPGDPPTPPGVALVPEAGVGADAAPVLPIPDPPSVEMHDSDVRRGLLEGVVDIAAAKTGPTPTGFIASWTNDRGDALPKPEELLRAEGPGARHVFLRGAPAPSEYLSTVAYLRAADGRLSFSKPAVLRADNYPRVFDVAAGLGREFLDSIRGVYDPASNKLLVAGTEVVDRPVLWRCDPAGTSCTRTDFGIAAGQATAVYGLSILDTPNGKRLLTSMRPPTGAGNIVLVHCALDGSGCVNDSLLNHAPTVKATAALQKSDGATSYFAMSENQQLRVLVCGNVTVPGSPCTQALPSPLANVVAYSLATASGRIYVTTLERSDAGPGSVYLYQCTLTPSGVCGALSKSVVSTIDTGDAPAIAVDPESLEAWVVPTGFSESLADELFRCGTTGSAPVCAKVPRPAITSPKAVGAMFEKPGQLGVVMSGVGGLRYLRCVPGQPSGGTCAFVGTPVFSANELFVTAADGGIPVIVARDAIRSAVVALRCPADQPQCESSHELTVQDETSRGNLVQIRHRVEVAVQASTRRVVMVAADPASSRHPRVFLTDSDGASAKSQLLAPQDIAEGSGLAPHVLGASDSVTVVTDDFSGGRNGRSSAFSCDKEGTQCTRRNAIFGVGTPIHRLRGAEFLSFDTEAPQHLLVQGGNALVSYRCTQDFLSCRATAPTTIGSVVASSESFDNAAAFIRPSDGAS